MAEVKVYAINVQKFLDDSSLFKEALLSMPSYRKEAIDKYRKIEDKARSLGAGVVLKAALDEYLKEQQITDGRDKLAGHEAGTLDGEALTEASVIVYGKFGKPYFENYPDFKFNISHSGTIAICAVSDTEVGCDIELIRDVNLKAARKVFSEEEKKIFECLDEAEQKEMFFKIWTAKESVVKALGKGIAQDFTDFSVWNEEEILVNETKLFLKQIHIADGYASAVCLENKDVKNMDINIAVKWIV